MELLSQLLSNMRVRGSVYFCDVLETPWEKLFSDTETASFHMVRRGECLVEVDGQQDYLGPGDLIFLGKGVDHRLFSRSVESQTNEPAISTLLLCGYCEFITEPSNPLFDLFPSMVIVRNEELKVTPG